MKRFSTLFVGMATAFFLCFISFQATGQGNEKSSLVLRVTIDGVSQDFFNGRCGYSGFSWGPTVAAGFCGPIVWANNPDSFLCTAAPAASLTGKVALIRRGMGCALSLKAKNAEAGGATLALIANNEANGPGDDCFVTSAVGGGTDGDLITIPALLLSRTTANIIDAALGAGKAVSICFLRPDVEIADYYYPVSNAITAVSQIACDTFGFSADVTASGTDTRTNVTVTAYVEKADGTVLFSTDTTIASVAPLDTPTVVLPGLFVPTLGLGDYYIRYTTTSDAIGGVDPVKAQSGSDFHIQENLMAKEDGVTIGFRPGDIGEGWSVGTVYRLCKDNLDHYQVKTVEFTYGAAPADLPVTSVESTFYMFKVADDVAEDWSNFSITDFFSPSLEWIGLAPYEAPSDMTSYKMQQVQMADLNGTVGIPLENGKRYFVVTSYADSSKLVYHGFNEDQVDPGVSTVTYSTRWFLGGFQGNPNAVLRIYLDLASSTDEKPLPATALKVVPNPVQESLNLAIEFAQATDATITLADLNGRVLLIDNREGLTNETLSYPITNQMAAGTYLARIATKEGTRTVKFVVLK